jgi:hypothetical protein
MSSKTKHGVIVAARNVYLTSHMAQIQNASKGAIVFKCPRSRGLPNSSGESSYHYRSAVTIDQIRVNFKNSYS